MKSLRLYFGALAFAGFAFLPSVRAQQSSVGGTVTGHVICGDTQRPARFAHVMLYAIPAEITPVPASDTKPDQAQIIASFKALSSVSMAQTQTDADGAFTALNVAPGDYYVFASMPGYVEARNILQQAYDAGADLRRPIPGVAEVHVTAERSVTADVTMERGAAISGRVIWDDGSPVTGAIVTVVSAKNTEKALPSQFGMMGMMGIGGGSLSTSDDRGYFRLAGLAPGDYLVKATLQTRMQFAIQSGVMNMNGMMMDSPLVVFAPNAFHQTDAKAVTLHASEDRADEDVTLNLSGLHTVSGRVTSAEDSHGINSATVKLEDAQDKKFSRSAGVDANGNFTVTFVPPGTYNMIVTGAADKEPSKKKPTGLIRMTMDETMRSYEDGKQAVTVTDGDVNGQNIALTPSKTVKKDVDFNELMKNMSN